MEELHAYISSLMDFPESAWATLQPALTPMDFAKGGDLLLAGKPCNSLFFIAEGYCRAFVDKDGLESNTAFFFEGEIATNIGSFGSGEPSAFTIQAAEPVRAVRFDKLRLREAALQDSAIETLGRKCLQTIAARQEKFAPIYQLMNPQERYTWLEQEYPEILLRVPQTQLASWLGVARETISRIRKRRL